MRCVFERGLIGCGLIVLLSACGQFADRDMDGDGFNESVDCDDTDANVRPSAKEYCNGVDDDCDGEVDEAAFDAMIMFPDADGDGFGNYVGATASCALSSGFSDNAQDCDDENGRVNPGEAERCNGIDDDCDGVIDHESVDADLWYRDQDKDGYGGDYSVEGCEQPQGFILTGGDCDDLDFYVNPFAAEVCDKVDNDCDGIIDEDCAR